MDNLRFCCAKLKHLVIACAFVIFTPSLFAVSREDFNFTVEPLLGIKCGTLGEYVYTKDSYGKDAKLSELDWNMKPIFYGSMGLLFAYKRFHLDSRFRLYFASQCGSMTDSDWMNITIPGAINNRTNYSTSDNDLQFGLQLDFTASWCVDLPIKNVSLYPFAAFEWETLDFRAINGTGIYADTNTLASNNGQPKEYKKGELMGIDYKRYTLFTWTGLELNISPFDRLSMTFAASIAPFTYIQSLDTHYAPKGEQTRYYNDRLSKWFAAYRFSTGSTFRVSDRTSVMINAAYTFSRQLQGGTYAKTDKGSFKRDETSSARADFSDIDISIGARYRFVP